MLTFEDVKNNETIRTYIQRADESLIALCSEIGRASCRERV